MAATANAGNTMISRHDLGYLYSLSDGQLYSGDAADVVITVESARDPTQVEHNEGEKIQENQLKVLSIEYSESACVN